MMIVLGILLGIFFAVLGLYIGNRVLNSSVLLYGPVYVPSDPRTVAIMLRLAHIGPEDSILDLGSGDGSIVIAAMKHSCAGSYTGIEMNPILVHRSRKQVQNLQKIMKNKAKVKIIQGNFWKHNLRPYTVVFIYAGQSIMSQLEHKILAEMQPGSRVITNTFRLPTLSVDFQYQNVFMYILK